MPADELWINHDGVFRYVKRTLYRATAARVTGLDPIVVTALRSAAPSNTELRENPDGTIELRSLGGEFGREWVNRLMLGVARALAPPYAPKSIAFGAQAFACPANTDCACNTLGGCVETPDQFALRALGERGYRVLGRWSFVVPPQPTPVREMSGWELAVFRGYEVQVVDGLAWPEIREVEISDGRGSEGERFVSSLFTSALFAVVFARFGKGSLQLAEAVGRLEREPGMTTPASDTLSRAWAPVIREPLVPVLARP